jgi:hypothetical protein
LVAVATLRQLVDERNKAEEEEARKKV